MNKKTLKLICIALISMAVFACKQASVENPEWRLAIQSYTFHRFPLTEALDKTQELGLQYIEVFPGHELGGKWGQLEFGFDMDAQTRKEIKELAASKGIKIISAGVFVSDNPDDWEKIFELAKDMDMEYITCEPKPEDWDLVESLVEKYGIKVAAHNHPQPSPYWKPGLLLEQISNRSDMIGSCADVGHWRREGLDQIYCLKQLEGRIVSLHFKDIAAKQDGDSEQHDVIWGAGILGVKSMLEELKQQNFKGVLSIEYENNWENSVPDIKQCIDYYHQAVKEIFSSEKKYYTADDYSKVPKIDAHFHYRSDDTTFMEEAVANNWKLMNILVVNILGPNFGKDKVEKDMNTARKMMKIYPDNYFFAGTFGLGNFDSEKFAEEAIAEIAQYVKEGARGIKIWKDIGMTLKDKNGNYVMSDNMAFAPIYEYLQKNGIPLLSHLGEPRNCWLPYDKMSIIGETEYWMAYPAYHAGSHPEMPSYEAIIVARDNMLEQYPDLIHIGCHLGSLEWDVDQIAARLDKYPNFYVDLSARVSYLKLQSALNREKVYNFIVKYQDRLLYGLDGTGVDRNWDVSLWKNEWNFLATNEAIETKEEFRASAPIPDIICGLQLPKEVIDKVYYENAKRIFKIIK